MTPNQRVRTMNQQPRSPSRLVRTLALAAAAILLPASVSLGDTIYYRSSPTAKPVGIKGKVTKIAKLGDADELYWVSEASGMEAHKPISDVVQIDCDAEPNLTTAEAAFVKEDWKSAGEAYRKASAATAADWVKRRATLRLLQVSQKSGDFQDAVAGFVEMARKDPTSASLNKPKVADAKPEQLDKAIAAVKQGSAGAKADSQQVLLPFLMDLYNAKGETAEAAKVLADLKKLGAPMPDPTASGNNTAAPSTINADAQRAEADVTLAQARKALTDGKLDQVTTIITTHSAIFTEPDRQADALWLLAEAKGAAATTPDALKEAGLAYMRVVANFKSSPTAPHVADALLKTAVIEEKLKQNAEALALYNQIAGEYASTDAGKQAKDSADRLGKGK
ncbi:MAG: hypothetical protein JWP03_1143 [Phycisphaerales bacterium]|jgi:TolA-binding protein|nr:hypothetical protein [Phycisphaerales bacterium]